jgi:hypothetical protein
LQHLIHGFPLSGPESGHTEQQAARNLRLSQPFSFIRTLTVGFGITPNLLTLFPKGGKRRSRAWVLSTLTAGGDFHPALRTSAARLSDLLMIMASGGRASKAFTPANPHVPMPSERHLEASPAILRGADPGRKKLTIKAGSESDSGLFSN